MPQIFGYIRMSKDTSDAENQRFDILRHLDGKKQVDHWVIETVTGTRSQDDRQLGALIDRLQPGDEVYIADVARIGRTVLDSMESASRIMKRKANLIFIEPFLELKDDPASELHFFALSLGARIQRDYISANTKRALARKKADGVKLGRPKGSTSTNRKLAAHEADIRTMLENRVSQAAIARTFGVSRDTVRKFVRELGRD